MFPTILLFLLMVSTRIQAATRDEPNAERFLQEEVRQILQEEVRQIFQMNLTGSTSLEAFEMIEKITATQTNLTSDVRELASAQNMIDNKITAIRDDLRHELASAQSMIDNKTTAIRDDLRQELGSVQAAVRTDQALMETNIVRRLNDTIKEHNKHNNVGQKYYFDLNQDDRDKMVEKIQITNAYLREIHPLVKSLACLSSPCQNGGTCTLSDDGSSYSCSCGPKVTGVNCENSEWITQGGRSYYVSKFSDTKCNYSTCRTACQRLGADLITIESAEEQTFVATITTHHTFWLSIYETTATVPGTWVVNQDSSEEITYTNWYGTEPNRASERCAVAYRPWGYTWLDAPCTWTRYYICEK